MACSLSLVILLALALAAMPVQGKKQTVKTSRKSVNAGKRNYRSATDNHDLARPIMKEIDRTNAKGKKRIAIIEAGGLTESTYVRYARQIREEIAPKMGRLDAEAQSQTAGAKQMRESREKIKKAKADAAVKAIAKASCKSDDDSDDDAFLA